MHARRTHAPAASVGTTAALLGVVAAAATVGAAGGPMVLRDVLSAAAGLVFLLAVGQRVGQDRLDALVVAVAGALIAVVLIGMVLGAVPGGIDRRGWFIGVGVVEAVVIGVVRPGIGRVPALGPVLRLIRPRHLWYPAGAVLVAAALAASVAASRHTDLAPLSLSVTARHGDTVTVEVAASGPRGPFDLVVEDGGDTAVVLADLRVGAAAPRTVTVALPVAGRTVLALTAGRDVVRQLVVVP